MKNTGVILLAALLCTFIGSCLCRKKKSADQSADKKYNLSGIVYEKHQYCGGARPTPEMENPQPVAKAGLKLYIRQGSVNISGGNIIDSVTTDENGRFSLNLPSGQYCLIENPKRQPYVVPPNDQYRTWDTACHRSQYQLCDYSIDLNEDKNNVTITFLRKCAWNIPCSSYSGPLPPSAPPQNRGGYQPGHQE